MWQTFGELRAARGILPATRALRWLVPTAMFERFRECEHRYLSPDAFRTLLADAGFEVIEMRRTFLAGISMLAWARVPEAAMT